ncbi:hypothetical protein MLD52_05515 [Puniceicoccaceae bacterium K14]|nr:hypothetical protein [Puniceicoccaceae bacterium K14]
MKVLFAAFSPTESNPSSPSADFISTAQSLSSDELVVSSVELPYEWDNAYPALERVLQQSWDAIVIVGMRKDIDSLAIERIALNERSGSVKDAHGRRPLNKDIVENGDPGYWTGLPFRSLAGEIGKAGVPCFASHASGGGIGNLVFYRLMKWIADSKSTMVGGLLQVPETVDSPVVSRESSRKVLSILLDNLVKISTLGDPDRLAFDVEKVKLFKESPTQ